MGPSSITTTTIRAGPTSCASTPVTSMDLFGRDTEGAGVAEGVETVGAGDAGTGAALGGAGGTGASTRRGGSGTIGEGGDGAATTCGGGGAGFTSAAISVAQA